MNLYAPDRFQPSLPPEQLQALLQQYMQQQGPQMPENYLATHFGDMITPQVGDETGMGRPPIDYQGPIAALLQQASTAPAPDFTNHMYQNPDAALAHTEALNPAPTPAQPSLQDSLLQQLMAANQQVMQGNDPSLMLGAEQQAAQGVNAAFNPQIGLLRQQNQGARHDTQVGSKQIRKMYAALQRSYQKVAKDEANAGAAEAKSLQDIKGRTVGQIDQSAANLINQNAAAGQALGSPELAAALNADTNTRTNRATAQAAFTGQREANAATRMSDASRTYMNQQGGNSILEGTNRAADLFGSLQDFLQGNRAKMGELAGQKAAALAQAKASIQGSFQNNTNKNANTYFDNLMNIAKLVESMQPKTPAKTPPDPFFSSLTPSVGNPLHTLQTLAGKDPQAAQELAQAYSQVSSDPTFMTKTWHNYNGKADLPMDNPANIMAALQANPDLHFDMLPNDLKAALTSMLMQQMGLR